MNTFEKFVRSIKPHHSYAQILLETDKGDEGLKQAFNLLNSVGLPPLNIRIIRHKSPILALMLLPSDDMRAAALKLSEAGFSRVLGINPSTSDMNFANSIPEMNDEKEPEID